jgi:hypothetical protein
MAWAIVQNNQVTKILNVASSVTINGVTHPKSIFTTWTKSDLASIGILPYIEERPDFRYYSAGSPTYSISETAVTATYNTVDRSVETLKADMLETIKSIAATRLAKTDWMVIRAAEGGAAVDADITTYRAAVRTASNDKEAEVNALTSLADVIAYQNQEYVEVRKVVTSTDDGEVTYGPETEEYTRMVNGATELWPADPQEEVDPAFVSLTAV